MHRNFDFHKTTMPASRNVDYYLCGLDSSVFIDFSSSPDNRISLIRISLDGFVCCNIKEKAKLRQIPLDSKSLGITNASQQKKIRTNLTRN